MIHKATTKRKAQLFMQAYEYVIPGYYDEFHYPDILESIQQLDFYENLEQLEDFISEHYTIVRDLVESRGLIDILSKLYKNN